MRAISLAMPDVAGSNLIGISLVAAEREGMSSPCSAASLPRLRRWPLRDEPFLIIANSMIAE
jgi:hypothetical protein